MVKHTKFTVHVISHTHWDREWYLPFSGFQRKLVKTIDRLLSILEHDQNYIYHLDGQVIILEDYLAVKPENEARLRKYSEEGRLIIGPWYVMPDEFLVSPESLYRNLKLGISRSRRFGTVMNVGYLPDTFGHIAQLPQILRKFGMDSAVVRRGMPGHPQDITTEFILASPDGSRVLTSFLVHGYTNARALGTPNRTFSWFCRKLMSFLKRPAFIGGRTNGVRDYIYHILLYPWAYKIIHWLTAIENCADRVGLIEREVSSLKKFTTMSHLMFLNGGDHHPPSKGTSKAIIEANERNEAIYLKQDTLENYFNSIRSHAAGLPVISTELRSSYYSPLLPGVLSARMYIKQLNHNIEDLLEKWGYLWASIANIISGKTYPGETLEQASQLLVQNHAHDTICGTSTNEVYRDVAVRLNKASVLLNKVAQDSLEAIAGNISKENLKDSELGLVVFNPSGHSRSEVVNFVLDKKNGNRYTILDWRDKPVLSQVNGDSIAFLASNVPALGYSLFRLVPSPTASTLSRFIAGKHTLENEFLLVDIHENGTFTVTHKPSKRKSSPMGYFEDGGDAGDTYNYATPYNDRVITSLNSKAKISLLSNGLAEATFRVDIILRLPLSLDIQARRRIRETAIPVTSFITLKTGSPIVYIRTEIENRARDHRLRVLFPSDIKTETCSAEGHWDIIERAINPEPELDSKAVEATGKQFSPLSGEESPSATQHQRRFVDVTDGAIGLAVINNGLPEYEVKNDDRRTIALTLLRCVGWLSRSYLPTRHDFAGPVRRVANAQCLGKHIFEYAVMPHDGDWEQAGVYIEAENHNVPCRVVPVKQAAGSMPSVYSFASISTESLVLSSLDISEGGALLLRLYNISKKPVTGKMKTGFKIKSAHIVDFNERIIQDLKVSGNDIFFEVRAKEVIMLSLEV